MVYKPGKRFGQIHRFVRSYWILFLVLAFSLLSFYTSQPSYGAAAAKPTPDVNTVPKPVATPTPEDTPIPTPTTSSDNGASDPGNDGNAALPGDDNQGSDHQNNSGDSDATTNTGDASGVLPADSGDTATGSTQNEPNGVTGFVTAVTLNLRKGPNATARVIDTLFLHDQVAILGRNRTGDWLYICCGSRTKLAGWVSKQLVTINFVGNQQMSSIPLFEGTSDLATANASTVNAGDTPAEGSLALEMRPLPSAAWQGQNIDLQFVVRNRSNQALTSVQLRNDLPDELAVVKVQSGSQGQVNYNGARQSGPVVIIDWSTVQANSQVTATVTVQIAANIADGALIDNLAVVKTREGATASAGITLAMPPVALPQFREP